MPVNISLLRKHNDVSNERSEQNCVMQILPNIIEKLIEIWKHKVRDSFQEVLFHASLMSYQIHKILLKTHAVNTSVCINRFN